MSLQFIRQDITKMETDAIVNAANESLLGGGGVDGAIHAAAGPGLLAECRTRGGCKTGDAVITWAYRLPCTYVIHTVGPVYRDGKHGEEALLRSCYRKSLELAVSHGCRSVAFPLISSGIYGYPKEEALSVAVTEIRGFLAESEADLEVYMVLFDKASFSVSETLRAEVQSFIDDHYTAPYERELRKRKKCDNFSAPALGMMHAAKEAEDDRKQLRKNAGQGGKRPAGGGISADSAVPESFLEICAEIESADATACFSESSAKLPFVLDESFSEMLLRIIDEKGMKDTEAYKAANIDRKLFSKIRSDVHYQPSKRTALAFCIALKLSMAEADELLMKAGYAFSDSVLSDVIVRYFIEKKVYDIFTVNEMLFDYDQPLLGGV